MLRDVLPLIGMALLAGGCFDAAEPFRASGIGFGPALDAMIGPIGPIGPISDPARDPAGDPTGVDAGTFSVDSANTPVIVNDASVDGDSDSEDAGKDAGHDAPSSDLGDAVAEALPNTCAPGAAPISADVVSIEAGSGGPGGGPAVKGDPLKLRLVIRNDGADARMATITAFIDSRRFADFAAVPVAAVDVVLCPGRNEVVVNAGPFLTDEARKKQYALGRGDYVVSSVDIEVPGQTRIVDRDFAGASFTVAASKALLVPIFYDARYFSQTPGFAGTPESFLAAAFQHPTEIFAPATADPDGPGSFQAFTGGFDQLMNVRHVFRPFAGYAVTGTPASAQAWCENAAAHALGALGLTDDWDRSGTNGNHHGFDYLIALTPSLNDSPRVCAALGVAVVGQPIRNLERQRLSLLEAAGQLFGAGRCEGVGNGSGGALQGFVMCAGERHAHYPAQFVWHATSVAQMRTVWD